MIKRGSEQAIGTIPVSVSGILVLDRNLKFGRSRLSLAGCLNSIRFHG